MTDEKLILIVDDDPDIRTFLEISLSLHGFEILEATDGSQALELAAEHRPDLILMDVMMPNLDGIEALKRLRANARTADIPVLLVTAKAQGADKIAGLAEGADDYITKPFDPEELVARVQTTLRRSVDMRAVSPLTGLPGNSRIEHELAARVAGPGSFALLYADLNQFKAYNDYYGFMAGDEVLKAFGELLLQVTAELEVTDAFVGHVGGDDFVVIAPLDRFEEIARRICERFDGIAPRFYRPEDLRLGYIEVTDRQGNITRFGPVSVSIGVAHDQVRSFTHPGQVVSVATEMKSFAKRASQGMSNWAVDRRADGLEDRPVVERRLEGEAGYPA